MEDKTLGNAKITPGVGIFADKKFIQRTLIGLVAIFTIFAVIKTLPKMKIPQILGICSGTSFPTSSNAQNLWPEIGKVLNIEIRPDCWSGWITIPNNAKYKLDAPGMHEYEFWGGTKVLVPDGSSPKWLGKIPRDCFRLRGDAGTVSIKVEAKPVITSKSFSSALPDN
ncbi:MAG: hypothetical protein PHN74_02325 [Candidatus Pacebacteria bacterium]|nr:hypothetical protein [Candidatus Paceibacterota bacterium]